MDPISLIFEHNPRHHIPIKIFGKKYDICARCLGTYTIGLSSFIIFGLLHIYGLSLSIYQVSLLSMGLAFICFIDWISAKTHIWDGNNKTRIVTGAFLGTAISLYFWFMPIPWIPRILSLLTIEILFGGIIVAVNYREYKKGLYDQYIEFYQRRYNKIFCCNLGCLGTCCTGIPTMLLVFLVGCCCICPIILIIGFRRM